MGQLMQAGHISMTDGENAYGYEILQDAFGEDSLVVAVESPRTLYQQGNQFIAIMLTVIAACCTVTLLVVLNLLNRIVVKPVRKLAGEVDGINMDTVAGTLNENNNSRELDGLARSMNGMLVRIQEDRDIIQENSEMFYYNANFDSLTGLRNRFSTARQIDEIIRKAKEARSHVSVFYMDLDRFKVINDTIGPTMGDQFIRAVAERMREHLGDTALLGRMGGDEFIMVQENLKEEIDRQYFVNRITDMFKTAFVVKERELHITASIGAANYPEDGQDAEMLLSNAEIAMYSAKEQGDGLYVSYRKELHSAIQRKIFIENRIREVIHDGCKEFRAFFQPKVHTQTKEIQSCEALIRWMAPDGIIAPMEFIPQAEECGLIVPLTWWMIRESCRQCAAFEKHGIINKVAINISAQVLAHGEFIEVLKQAVRDAGLTMNRVDIEITESTLLDDIERVNEVLSELHLMGVEISIDDFGTGYSSLSYLNKLEVDRIKIDRSFVMEIDAVDEKSAEDNREIVKAILAMAKTMNMVVTAEGVETEAQAAFLQENNCDELQGFLYSRPLPAEEYIAYVLSWKEAHKAMDN